MRPVRHAKTTTGFGRSFFRCRIEQAFARIRQAEKLTPFLDLRRSLIVTPREKTRHDATKPHFGAPAAIGATQRPSF
jgi:hypothetical protein